MTNVQLENLIQQLSASSDEILSVEINHVFNYLSHAYPLKVTSFSVNRNSQDQVLYQILQSQSEYLFTQKFKNQTLYFKFSIDKGLDVKESENILRIVAIHLNGRLNQYFEKEQIEDLLLNQHEEHFAFLKMFCHDLANPLSILKMSLEFIEEADSENQFTSILKRMIKSTNSIHELIQSVRELNTLQSRMKTLQVEPLSLKEVFKECKGKFQSALDEKNLELTLNLPKNEDVHFLADRQTFLNYILNNLISNAIKYSHPSSSIEIVGERIADQLVLNVVDHGIGMNDQQLAKIFKFDKNLQRLGTNGETGHGFGLQFCKYAVKLHGFQFQISSQESKSEETLGGTTISLTIPLSA